MLALLGAENRHRSELAVELARVQRPHNVRFPWWRHLPPHYPIPVKRGKEGVSLYLLCVIQRAAQTLARVARQQLDWIQQHQQTEITERQQTTQSSKRTKNAFCGSVAAGLDASNWKGTQKKTRGKTINAVRLGCSP